MGSVDNHFIETYENALSDEMCDNAVDTIRFLVDRAKEDPETFKKEVVFHNDKTRNDISIFPIAFQSCKEIVDGIYSSLNKHYDLYREKYTIGTKFEDAYFQNPKLQMSTSGGGFTNWHCEQGPNACSSRFLVWMFYLNDVEKGGKTDFFYQNISFQPKKGSLLIWPAAFTHTHRASPDLKEDKFIATGWFHYPSDYVPKPHIIS